MPRPFARPQPSSGSTALLLYLTVFAGFVAMYLPQPILPVLAREFSVGAGLAGLTISVLIFSLAGSSLLVGPLSDGIGRKPVLLGCTLLLAVPTLGCALAPGLGTLLAFRFLQGLVLPGLTAVSVAYIAEEFPAARVGAVLGGYVAATVTGGLVSRVFSGAVTATLGWRWTFVFSAVLVLLTGLLLTRLPPSRRFRANPKLRRAFVGMFAHLADRRLLGGFLVGFTLFFSFVAVFTYLPFHLEAPPYRYSTLAIGLIYLVYAAGIVSSPLAGALAQRFGPRAVMAAGLALALAANFATLLHGNVWLVLGLLVLCFGNFATQSTATAYVAEVARHERAGASALYLCAYYVGGSLGAFLPGLLWAAQGWPGVLLLTCSSLFAGILAALGLCRA